MIDLGGDQGIGGLGMIESLIMVQGRIIVPHQTEHSLATATILHQKREFQVDIVAHREFSIGGIAIRHLTEFPKAGVRVCKLTELIVVKVDCDGEHLDGPRSMMGSDWSILSNGYPSLRWK